MSKPTDKLTASSTLRIVKGIAYDKGGRLLGPVDMDIPLIQGGQAQTDDEVAHKGGVFLLLLVAIPVAAFWYLAWRGLMAVMA